MAVKSHPKSHPRLVDPTDRIWHHRDCSVSSPCRLRILGLLDIGSLHVDLERKRLLHDAFDLSFGAVLSYHQRTRQPHRLFGHLDGYGHVALGLLGKDRSNEDAIRRSWTGADFHLEVTFGFGGIGVGHPDAGVRILREASASATTEFRSGMFVQRAFPIVTVLMLSRMASRNPRRNCQYCVHRLYQPDTRSIP